MKNKTLIFALVISGFMGMVETASAVTFKCPHIEASDFQRIPAGGGGNTYYYYPKLKTLDLRADHVQPVSQNLQLNWTLGVNIPKVESANPDNPKDYKLVSVELKDASLDYDNHPICHYEWKFSNLLFPPNHSVYLEEPLETISVSNCTRHETVFICH